MSRWERRHLAGRVVNSSKQVLLRPLFGSRSRRLAELLAAVTAGLPGSARKKKGKAFFTFLFLPKDTKGVPIRGENESFYGSAGASN